MNDEVKCKPAFFIVFLYKMLKVLTTARRLSMYKAAKMNTLAAAKTEQIRELQTHA